jgi:DNA-binding CsgD family transcriptional regulator
MLVDRDAELAQLATSRRRADAGRGSLLLVEGPAGIGKSALLEAASDSTVLVLRARGTELERPLAFGVVRQLFEPVLANDPGEAKRLLTGAAAGARLVLGQGADQAPAAHTVHRALTWLTTNLASVRGLTLIIDDLHWADAASLGWLEHLTHRLATLPVLVVAAWRTTEPDSDEDALDRLRDEPSSVILRPAPLTRSGVDRVVRTAIPDADPAVCEACNRSTGGNPFLLTEVVRTIRARSSSGVVNVSDVRPESVQRSVNRRLTRLGQHVVRAAEACAVIGDGAASRHVTALSGLSATETAGALDRLADAQILQSGTGVNFVHPLVRLAVYDRIGAQTRALSHLEIARLYDAGHQDVERVALHLMLAPVRADEWVAQRLLDAGSAALARGAPREARAMLLRAQDERIVQLRPQILLALATAEQRIPHPDFALHARELFDDPEVDPLTRARALVLSQPLTAPTAASDPARDLEVAEAVAACLDLEDPEQADAALTLRAVINVARSLSKPREIDTIWAALSGHPVRTRGQRSMVATLVYEAAISGRASATECLTALRDALDADDVLENAADLQGLLVLLAADELPMLDVIVGRGLARSRSESAELLRAIYLGTSCALGWARGNLVQAESDGHAAVAGEAITEAIATTVAAPLIRVLIDRGKLENADVLALQHKPQGATLLGRAGMTLATAMLRSAQGRWEEAAELAQGIGRTHPYAAGAHLTGIPWRCVAAEALARLGKIDDARALLDQQRPLTRTWGTARQSAMLLRAEALVVDPVRGVDLCQEADALLEATELRTEQARTQLLLGSLLRRANKRSEAREALTRALDLAAVCNADGLAASAVDELKATGARPRRQRLYGAEALTASEERVARLAADGLSNQDIAQRQFVTRKTVESQLSSAYRKLGIEGRAQLRDALPPA